MNEQAPESIRSGIFYFEDGKRPILLIKDPQYKFYNALMIDAGEVQRRVVTIPDKERYFTQIATSDAEPRAIVRLVHKFQGSNSLSGQPFERAPKVELLLSLAEQQLKEQLA